MATVGICACKASDAQGGASREDGGRMLVTEPSDGSGPSMSTEPTVEDAGVVPARDAGASAGHGADARDAGPAMRSDASITSDAGPQPIDCDAFPSFDRTCKTANDCAVATRQVDCCGGTIATGIRAEEAIRFASAASECAQRFPLCGCAAGPTRADDGTTGNDGATATVACVGGTCTTTFTSALKPCGPNGLGCDTASEICVSREPVGPAIIYECRPVPVGCETDRSCACLASELCAPSYDTCFDDDPDVLKCVCPICQ